MKISVLNYLSLKDFLADFVAESKGEDPDWSIAAWAKKLGLKSTTSMTMIINGQRNCGKSIQKALLDYFQFSEDERKHFDYLVGISKVASDSSVSGILKNEIKLGAQLKKTLIISDSELDEIKGWHFYLLRQLARISPLQLDESWLRKKISYDGSASLCAAVSKLFELGFLEKIESGLTATNVILATTQNVSSEPIKQYHEDMGHLAIKAVRKFDVDRRSFQGSTLKVREDKLDDAKKLIEEFVVRFGALNDASDGNAIYQINIQFFPLAVIDAQ